MITETQNLQKYTKLPINVVQIADRILPDIIVKTPFGDRSILLTKESYSLLGNINKQEKHFREIFKELAELEIESKDYLIDKWLKTLI